MGVKLISETWVESILEPSRALLSARIRLKRKDLSQMIDFQIKILESEMSYSNHSPELQEKIILWKLVNAFMESDGNLLFTNTK